MPPWGVNRTSGCPVGARPAVCSLHPGRGCEDGTLQALRVSTGCPWSPPASHSPGRRGGLQRGPSKGPDRQMPTTSTWGDGTEASPGGDLSPSGPTGRSAPRRVCLPAAARLPSPPTAPEEARAPHPQWDHPSGSRSGQPATASGRGCDLARAGE